MQPYKFCAVLPKLRFVSLPVMRILFEVGRMWWLVLCIKLAFPLRFVLVVLGLVGLEVLLMYHVGTRSSLSDPSTCVYCSRLLLKIKTANEIQNIKLMSLVFQRSSKIIPRRWKLGNDGHSNNFVRQHTLKVLKFLREWLCLMSLLNNIRSSVIL